MSEVYDPRMGYSTPRSQRSSGEVSLLLLEDSGLEGEGDNCWHRAAVLWLHSGGLKVGSELRAREGTLEVLYDAHIAKGSVDSIVLDKERIPLDLTVEQIL